MARPILHRNLIACGLIAACAFGVACRESSTAPGKHTASLQAALPKLGALQPFDLTDHRGKPFTTETMRGKVWVAAFLFTRCPSICPQMMRRMKGLQQAAKSRAISLHLTSFSVDPDNDTPEVLSAYAKRFDVDTASWTFVTGDSATIRNAAEHGFKIGVEGTADPKAADFGITHGSHLVLLDSELTIRGYYRSTDPEQMDKLLSAAQQLGNE